MVTPGSTDPGRVALLVVLEVGWLAEDEGLIEFVRTEACVPGEDPPCEILFTIAAMSAHCVLASANCALMPANSSVSFFVCVFSSSTSVWSSLLLALSSASLALSSSNAACKMPLLEVFFSIAIRIAASVFYNRFPETRGALHSRRGLLAAICFVCGSVVVHLARKILPA